MTGLRDRIKELRRVPAKDLLPNEKNWRSHPQAQQDAMRGILAEIGIADAVLAYETPAGLKLIDGHLRADLSPDAMWPVLVLDVSEAEADKILATHDPLAAMAETDVVALDNLLRDVQTGDESLAAMLSSMANEAGIIPPDEQRDVVLKQIDPKPPPRMAWVLLGIPVVRFGEIAADVVKLSAITGIICETTQNDG